MTIDQETGNAPYANEHATFLQKGFDEVKANLTLAQECMKEYYDQQHQKDEEIWEGDQVCITIFGVMSSWLYRYM